jgi:hypothetical protein
LITLGQFWPQKYRKILLPPKGAGPALLPEGIFFSRNLLSYGHRQLGEDKLRQQSWSGDGEPDSVSGLAMSASYALSYLASAIFSPKVLVYDNFLNSG